MNSKYVTSWNVQLLPNGVYELIFNTTERWISYYRMNDSLYVVGEEEIDESTEMFQSRVQNIPEFLPKMKNVMWMNSHTQEKDQIIFYFIPFQTNWLKEGKIKTILDSNESKNI
jgi:hypothetical protein